MPSYTSVEHDFQLGVSFNRGKRTFFYLRPRTPQAIRLMKKIGVSQPLEVLSRSNVCEPLGLCVREYRAKYGTMPKITMDGVSAEDKSYFRCYIKTTS